MESLESVVSRALAEFAATEDAAQLERVKAQYLGKQGKLTELLKGLGQLAPEARRDAGARINEAKDRIEAALAARRGEIANARLEARLAEEAIDVTLPGRGRGRGSVHPIIRTWQRIEEIFGSIGFDVADGPEIETDWHNFTALNQPEDHPARSMHDTFYVEGHDSTGKPLLLRTHTSPMQVRYARMHKPPIKVIAPGRTYRVDSDATHSPMFHQVEGLWIDEDISFADLKGVYTDFLRRFFETDDLQVRFRPSFFPFTEPSAEIDMMFASGPLVNIMSISADGSVNGKNDGRNRTCRPSVSKKRRMKSAYTALRSAKLMSSSIHRPSTWWNIGEWVASESTR